MESLNTWQPCFENRQLGVAFFDNLTFETDMLTDPRWDRVLPIMEEEQILQCRLMRRLLTELVEYHSSHHLPSPKVLDLGTGCGVFAIYAAMLGCDVDAIDISQRAINFAQQNLDKNTKNIHPNGNVKLVHRDYCSMNVDGAYDNKYDVIVVAPPYNPTLPCCRPALHADGGIDGQGKFLELLDIVPPMLKVGGVCLGNHMFIIEANEFKDRALYRQRLCAFELNYTRIIERDISASEFIKAQYRSFLQNPMTADATREYEAFFTPEMQFGLAYFELTKTNNSSGLVVNRPKQLGVNLNCDWGRRIELHRTIVECSRHYAAIPAEFFLLNVRSVPDLAAPLEKYSFASKSSALSKPPHPSKNDDSWCDSVLSLVDQWIANSDIFNEESGISFVLVDSAPWYPTTKSPNGMRQDCAIWMGTSNAISSEERVHLGTIAEQLISGYQNNTKALQTMRICPVFHPSFTGRSEPTHWRDIHFTSLNRGANGEGDGTLAHKYAVEYANGTHSEDGEDPFTPPFEDPKFKPDSRANAVIRRSSVPLSELKSPLAASTVELSVRKRIQAFRSNDNSFNTYSIDELLAFDLSVCHLAMHRQLHNLTDDVLTERTFGKVECSFLASMPVTLGNFDAPIAAGRIPDSFRGGVWVYVVSKKPWCTDLERSVKALCRTAYLVADAKYTYLTAAEVRGSEAASNRMQFSHTVQSQVRLLKPAINLATEQSIREPAQAALRRLQFAVNLFTPTMYGSLKDFIPIPWAQCFRDSAIMTRVRLKARSAVGVAKLIDEAACRGSKSAEKTNEAILASLELLLKEWNASETPIYESLGIEKAIKEMEGVNLITRWDDEGESGLITYLLEQAMFHGAVFISGKDILPVPVVTERSVVKVRWISKSRTLTISNRVLSSDFDYLSTTDFKTIANLVAKFDEQIQFAFSFDEVWFNASLIYANGEEK